MIPYSRQTITAEDIREVVKTLKGDYLTQGPKIREFENAICAYTGAKYCVAFNSGTAALHGAYFAAGIDKGDEVIVPAITFAATANAAMYLGAKPVFADVEPTGSIDISSVQKNLRKKTKALVAVDYAGRPSDLGACKKFARKHRLIFIEDGAQSLGASYKGRPVGTQADMTMFSFHPVKSITTGEGGVVVTNNVRYYKKMLMFRSHGLTRDKKIMREKGFAQWHQEMHLLGFNYRMTDIQAALGVSQLKKLDSFVAKRRTAAKAYYKLLQNVKGISLPAADTRDITSAWHLYPIRIEGGRKIRDGVFKNMRELGIGVQVHYLPVYLHPFYKDQSYPSGLCPEAEKFSFSEISLPLYPSLTPSQQRDVVKALEGSLKKKAV